MEYAIMSKEAQEVLDSKNVSHFPSPHDWRDHWIYFLLVDRFNMAGASSQNVTFPCNTYQGGNFEGIRQQLPYLQKLGVGALWLSPVLKNPFWFKDYWGGYGIENFLTIEPRFCSNPAQAQQNPELADKEFRQLVDEAHALGIYIILDIVLNHTADLFNYEGMRDSAPWNPEREYQVFWRDNIGQAHGDWTEIDRVPENAGIMPRELRHNEYFRRRGDYHDPNLTMGDFSRMKDLKTEYHTPDNVYPVRNLLIRSYQYLISKFDIDGFRIDTLQFIETDFARIFGNAIREYALSIGKKNFETFGEIWQDEDERITEFVGRNTHKNGDIVGVDAAINFPFRKRLVDVCKGFAPPSELANHFKYQQEVWSKILTSHGNANSHYVNFCDNHDLNARFHNPAYPGQSRLMLTVLMTWLGIPCIYYGEEQGMSGNGDRREYSRGAMWGIPNAFSTINEFYKEIKKLSELRNYLPALKYGRQYCRPCSGDGFNFGFSESREGGILAYSRILNDKEVLVACNTHTTKKIKVYILVDGCLSPASKKWDVVFSTNNVSGKFPTEILYNGTHVVQINLDPMEAMIIA